jgi:type IV pilus assembly protein PilA
MSNWEALANRTGPEGAMSINVRESKGFTLVELMIVVAIIGILAAVAVPYYQKYIQKARLTSMVFPGVHAIETNMATYYSLNGSFPGNGTFLTLCADANTQYFTPSRIAASTFKIVIIGGNTSPLKALGGTTNGTLIAHAVTYRNMITSWQMSGSLATSLGLAGPQ